MNTAPTGPALRGALMVCGTTSDAGKSTVVTGLCRSLARRGVRVAPFKAQNMALNSAVTPSGHEIGRAQAAQADAAGVDPEVAMNPILLKPTSDRTSQVVVLGEPWAVLDAAAYHQAKPGLLGLVLDQLAGLRARFDVVVCEGAGSPAEINLLDGDIVNLAVADAAGMPAVIVGDIERGGVFAALYGTVSLLPEQLRRRVGGFVINKFRGDPDLLAGGPGELELRCGVPTLGVLPWAPDLELDAEDSLALARLAATRRRPGEAVLDVAVVRFPRISNFTDLDVLTLEPGVALRLVDSRAALGRPDVVVLPGTKATVADLAWLRASGLAGAVVALATDPAATTTVVGLCGGYQMLGSRIDDPVESATAQPVQGLGLLDAATTFVPNKVTRRRQGHACGHPVSGYQIHHGRTRSEQGWVLLEQAHDDPGGTGTEREGCRSADGRVFGTSLHGLWDADGFRGAFLAAAAARAGKPWQPSGVRFAAARQSRFERLADLVDEHLDLAALDRLIAGAGSGPAGSGPTATAHPWSAP